MNSRSLFVRSRLYRVLLCVAVCHAVRSVSQVAAQSASCNWCRRVNLDGSPASDRSVCRSCSGYEFRCDASFELTNTCTDLSLNDTANGKMQATCQDVDADKSYRTTQITLNQFIGNQDGQLILGGSGYSSSCSNPSIFGGYLTASCSTIRGQRSDAVFNLNAVLANVRGQVMLLAPLPAQSTNVAPPYSGNLPPCSTVRCSEGFLFNRAGTLGSTCIPCNVTDAAATAGRYCDGIHATPQSCPAGFYCTALDQPKKQCDASCLCDGGASSACPKQCDAGYICRPGTASIPCPATKYCVAGAMSASPCDEICVCDIGSSTSCPRVCPAGRVCSSGKETGYCPLGSYCQNGATIPCPANTFGDEFGLMDDSCSGRCGVMWKSKEGSVVCNEYSAGGIVIIVIIVCVSIPTLLLGAAFGFSKLLAWRSRQTAGTPGLTKTRAEVAFSDRILKQKQIRDGITALALHVVKNSFPSTFAVYSTLNQLKLDASHPEARIAAAKQELTDIITGRLLVHPRLHFDDESYPRNLPQWVTLDATSTDYESELYATGNLIASHIRAGVEQDLLSRIQNAPAAQSKSLDEEEKLPLTPIVHDEQLENKSKWSTVDKDLSVALRVVLPQSKWSAVRKEYSQSSASAHGGAQRSIFYLCFDALVIVACAFCFAGEPLIDASVTGSNLSTNTSTYNPLQHSDLKLSWHAIQQPSSRSALSGYSYYYYYYYYDSYYDNYVDLNLLQPALGDCTGDTGSTYFAFLVIACICSLQAILLTTSRLSVATLPAACARYVRRSSKSTHFLEIGGRVLSLLSLVISVSAYATGCIARLALNPPLAITRFSSLIPSNPPQTKLDFDIHLKVAAAFPLAIAALTGSLLTTAIALEPYLFNYSKKLGVIDANQDSVPVKQLDEGAVVQLSSLTAGDLVAVVPTTNVAPSAGPLQIIQHAALDDSEPEVSQYAVAFHLEAEEVPEDETRRTEVDNVRLASSSPAVLSPSNSPAAVIISH